MRCCVLMAVTTQIVPYGIRCRAGKYIPVFKKNLLSSPSSFPCRNLFRRYCTQFKTAVYGELFVKTVWHTTDYVENAEYRNTT
jgi:hypothetical protein